MSRNYTTFPDDENGDVLWHMARDGDNLSLAREITFSVIFPTEISALDFALLLLKSGQKVSFARGEGNDEFPWQVETHPFMLPTHDNISGYEAELADDAAAFAGRSDGWGCFAQD